MEIDKDLRVYRTWTWEAIPGAPVLIGGPPAPLQLVAHHELQYKMPDGEWKAIPVVDAEKPEHPADVARRAQTEALRELMQGMAEIIAPALVSAAAPTETPLHDSLRRR